VHENVIIVPIYSGHMERMIEFLGNVAGRLAGTTLVFCASNAWEAKMFRGLSSLFGDSIVVLDAEALASTLSPDAVHRLLHDIDHCTIPLKKYLALRHCFENGAKSAAVLDSDTVFLPRFDATKFFAVLDHNYYLGLALGGRVDGQMGPAIVKACHAFLWPGQPQQPAIDANWYGWFFDVPYYKAVDFMGMLSYLTKVYSDGWWNHYGWFAFDHMVYTYYRVGVGEADLAIYSDVCEVIPEFLMPPQLRAVWSKYDQYPAWISYPMVAQDPALVADNPNAMLICHTDRCKFASGA